MVRIGIKAEGVLGMNVQGEKKSAVGQCTVVVDPAGLPHIRSGPTNAGGASRAIYKWLGFRAGDMFPERVQNIVSSEGKACYHQYDQDKHVIHAVGPNFKNNTGCPNRR